MDYATSRPVTSFLPTVKEILLSPREFFASIERQGKLASPLVFAILCTFVSILVSGLYSLGISAMGGDPAAAGLPAVGVGTGFIILGVMLVFSPLFALLGVYIGAAILHVLVWAIFRGGNRGFERTLRVVAYASSALSLLVWIPLLGLLVNVYGVYVNAVGLEGLHSATFRRALVVASLPFFFGLASAAFTLYCTDVTLGQFLLRGGGPLPPQMGGR
jgi:hypothetical protein